MGPDSTGLRCDEQQEKQIDSTLDVNSTGPRRDDQREQQPDSTRDVTAQAYVVMINGNSKSTANWT